MTKNTKTKPTNDQKRYPTHHFHGVTKHGEERQFAACWPITKGDGYSIRLDDHASTVTFDGMGVVAYQELVARQPKNPGKDDAPAYVLWVPVKDRPWIAIGDIRKGQGVFDINIWNDKAHIKLFDGEEVSNLYQATMKLAETRGSA